MKDTYTDRALSSTRRFRLVFLATILVLVAGTGGFMILEDMGPLDALYMTTITLSTVGFGEVSTLHPAGRVFVILLILFGVAIAASFAALLGEQVLEGHFTLMVARKKMEKKLKKLSGHYIVAGFGRVGRQVAKEFFSKDIQCVVIEKGESNVNDCVALGLLAVEGDATDDDILNKAGIKEAHTLISTLPDEAHNVYLTLTARFMNPDLRIIARADYEEGEKKLLRAGADHVVIPHVLGGIRMAKAALQPNVVDFMQMASMGEEGLLVEELAIPIGSTLEGKTLAESDLKKKYGISIIGIKQSGRKMNINPGASTRLTGRDVIVVIGGTEHLEQFSRDIAPV